MARVLEFHHPYFEESVRKALNIYDRPILDTDAKMLEELECDFWFENEDAETLTAFCNLKRLDIEVSGEVLPAIAKLSLLEELAIVGGSTNNEVDFQTFSALTKLRKLTVSGGDYSSMNLCHLEALVELKNLTHLWLHEFGKVDLKPLEEMTWLKFLFCGYAVAVENVEAISKLIHLECIELVDFEVEDLCFMESLPETTEIEILGMKINRKYDLNRLNRFKVRDISENTVAGEWVAGY